MGGLAAVIQGAPVTTMDVDVVHQRSEENIEKLFLFLKTIDAVHRRPDGVILEPRLADISGMGHALFSTRLGALDILAFIEQNQTYEDLVKHTVELPFRNLIKNKYRK